MPSGGDLQFDRVALFGGVDERRDRQAPVEAQRITLRETTADQTSDEAARHDRGGSDCKLASVQHQLQTSLFPVERGQWLASPAQPTRLRVNDKCDLP